MNAGHLLGAEEHGSSFGGIKNEVHLYEEHLLSSSIALDDGGRFAVGI